MKHIKSFEMKNYEGDMDIIATLEDISLEVKDDGFVVKIGSTSKAGFSGNGKFKDRPWTKGLYVLEVVIEKWGDDFQLSDIYSCIRRMVDYMNIEGYNCSIFGGYGKDWVGISLPSSEKGLNDSLSRDRKYDYINLKFSKKY